MCGLYEDKQALSQASASAAPVYLSTETGLQIRADVLCEFLSSLYMVMGEATFREDGELSMVSSKKRDNFFHDTMSKILG